MESIAATILQAVRELGFGTNRCERLPVDEASGVYEAALRHYVPEGSPKWWWEHFPVSTGVHFEAGDGWRQLSRLVPNPDERVWLIAEDEGLPGYSVWTARVRDIAAVLGECPAFEYYLVQPEFRWLLCENHHNVLIAVGEEVEERLRTCRRA